MAYEIRIRCDIRTGNPLEKALCHSDQRSGQPQPEATDKIIADAARSADRRARAMGWKTARQSAGAAKWCCPACVSNGRIAGKIT